MGYIFDAIQRAQRETPRRDDPAPPPDVEAATDLSDHASAEAATVDPAADAPPLAFANSEVGEPAAGLDDRLVALAAPDSVMAEEYRSIRTTLLARCGHKRRLVHTITSATPREGKTITSLNLGLSFGELRNRATVVVEADLRLPTFDSLLDLKPGPGLWHYLRGQATLSDVIHTVDGSRLRVIPAGQRCGAEAIQLLSNPRMADLLKTLRSRFDHAIVDTPPVTELADAGILGALSDEVMLVVRMGRTPRPLVEQAIRTLRGYHAPVAGLIATDHKPPSGRYGYRYGYRYLSSQRRAA